jgi:hypothetical protein
MSNPRYVFLDQNHWIYLAKAYYGKPHRPVHVDLLDPLLTAISRDEIRLPISSLHLIELLRNESKHRRLNLAEVFERFGAGWYIGAWSHILPGEIDRAIAKVLALPMPPSGPEVFGRGFLYGLPPSARENFEGRFGAETFEKIARIASLPGAILDLITFQDEEGRYHQKTAISARSERDAESIEGTRHVFRSESKALHRRAKLAKYTYYFQSQLASSLSRVGHSLESFFSHGTEFAVRFWSEIPSLHVDCELTLYRDRQWTRVIDPNDSEDLAHLSIAVPYCAAVVGERFWSRALEETGLAHEYGTTVCTDLEEIRSVIAV